MLDHIVEIYLRRQADLTPPLGRPGGPGYLEDRIKHLVHDPGLEHKLVDEIEHGIDLSNDEAAKVYQLDAEPGVGIIKEILIGPHAEYRMDWRSITVGNVQFAIKSFLKEFNDAKSRKDWQHADWSETLKRGEPITYTSPQGLTVVFKATRPDQIKIVTTYWKGRQDPKTHKHASVEDALVRLDALPSLKDGGCAPSEDCVSALAIFKKDHVVGAAFGLRTQDLAKAKPARLSADAIWPAQDFINREQLREYILHPPSELPLVVQYTDGRYIAQNHTRIAAQILTGQSHVNVRLLVYVGRPEYYRSPDIKRFAAAPKGIRFNGEGIDTAAVKGDKPSLSPDQYHREHGKCPDGFHWDDSRCEKTAGFRDDGELSGYKTYVKEQDGTQKGEPRPGENEEKHQALPEPWKRKKDIGPTSINTPGGSGSAPDGRSIHKDKVRTPGEPGRMGPVNNPSRNSPVRRPDVTATEGAARKFYLKNRGKLRRKMHRKMHDPRHVEKTRKRHKRHPKASSPIQFYYDLTDQYGELLGITEDGVATVMLDGHPEDIPVDIFLANMVPATEADYERLFAVLDGTFGLSKFDDTVEGEIEVDEHTKQADEMVRREPVESDPGQHFDRAGPGQGDQWPHHPSQSGFDTDVSVPDNPGSARVIPDNKDFVNHKDRIATRISEIIEGCDAQTRAKAADLPVKLRRVSPSNTWAFDVHGSSGDYRVRLKALPSGNATSIGKMNVLVSCTCPFWRWRGPEHWAKAGGYLYGKPVGTASSPDVKDPAHQHLACKHVLAVLEHASNIEIPKSRRTQRLATFLDTRRATVSFRDGDLEDALEYLNRKQSPPKWSKDTIDFQGVEMMTPAEFVARDKKHKTITLEPFGWAKGKSPAAVVKAVDHMFGEDGSTKRIMNNYQSGRMSPAIQIDGLVGDGLHRAVFYQALGEKMPVAVFRSKGKHAALKLAHTASVMRVASRWEALQRNRG